MKKKKEKKTNTWLQRHTTWVMRRRRHNRARATRGEGATREEGATPRDMWRRQDDVARATQQVRCDEGGGKGA